MADLGCVSISFWRLCETRQIPINSWRPWLEDPREVRGNNVRQIVDCKVTGVTAAPLDMFDPKTEYLWSHSPNTNSSPSACRARSLSGKLHLETINSEPARNSHSGWLGMDKAQWPVEDLETLRTATNSQSVDAKQNAGADARSAISSACSALHSSDVRITVRRWTGLILSVRWWIFLSFGLQAIEAHASYGHAIMTYWRLVHSTQNVHHLWYKLC